MQASLSWLRQGYLPPESRSQNNFDKGKASEYDRSIVLTLEHQWNEDPADDPFAGGFGSQSVSQH